LSKISAYTTLVSPVGNDLLPIVDVSDTSMAASGTTKRVTANALAMAFGTAVFAGTAGRTVADAVTNGTTTVTSASAAFTSADVGSLVVITGSADGDAAAGHSFASAIASVTNGTTAVLAATPSFSITAANLSIGADNKNAINSFLTSVGNGGTFGIAGRGYIPPGVYLSSGQHTQPGATIITGAGYDYTSVDAPPQAGSVLMYAGTAGVSYFWQMGSTSTVSTGQQNAVLDSLAIDASNLAQSAVLSTSVRNLVRNALIWRGSSNALQLSGGSAWITESVLGQQNLGDVLFAVGGDVHVVATILRDPGSGGACAHLRNVNDFLFTGNHCWSGGNSAVSSAFPCNNILIDNTVSGSDVDNYCITGNLFDGVYGHAIVLNPTGGGSCRISDVTIAGNSFFAVNGFPDNTFYAVFLNTSTNNNVRGLTISSNAVRGVEGGTNSWAGLLGWAGAGSVSQLAVSDNSGMGVRSIWPSGLRPDGARTGNVFTATCTSATSIASSNDGTATFSGTGALTAFVINHGLAATPTTVTITAASAAAAAPFFWTASSSTITVTYLAAPASGSNNVVLSWSAVI